MLKWVLFCVSPLVSLSPPPPFFLICPSIFADKFGTNNLLFLSYHCRWRKVMKIITRTNDSWTKMASDQRNAKAKMKNERRKCQQFGKLSRNSRKKQINLIFNLTHDRNEMFFPFDYIRKFHQLTLITPLKGN